MQQCNHIVLLKGLVDGVSRLLCHQLPNLLANLVVLRVAISPILKQLIPSDFIRVRQHRGIVCFAYTNVDS